VTNLHILIESGVILLTLLDAILLSRLYFSHRTGNMPHLAAVGVMSLYLGVAVNHGFLTTSDHELLPGSAIILFGQLITLISLLTLMRINLFRHR
jgi:hypothetical protein